MNQASEAILLAALSPEKTAALRLLIYGTFAGLLALVVLITAFLLLRTRRQTRLTRAERDRAAAAPSAWEVAGRRAPPLSPGVDPASGTVSSTGDTVDIDPDDPGSVDIGPDDVGPGNEPDGDDEKDTP